MSEKDYLSKQDSVHKSKINMTKEISKQFKADQRRIFEDNIVPGIEWCLKCKGTKA